MIITEPFDGVVQHQLLLRDHFDLDPCSPDGYHGSHCQLLPCTWSGLIASSKNPPGKIKDLRCDYFFRNLMCHLFPSISSSVFSVQYSKKGSSHRLFEQ